MLNVAVTGSGGFIGSKLMSRSGGEFNFFPLDLRSLMLGQDVQHKTIPVHHVIHLAAKTFVPDSWKTPADFYKVNVMGTQAVLDYCREQNCSMTYVSSYVYGVPAYLPVDEAHPVAPNTPYNHSKLMGEDLCEFYNRCFKTNIAVVRPFNIYGPGQQGSFLIPTIVSQLLQKDQIQLQDLEPKRDYLYIDDFTDALVSTIKFTGFDTFNLGAGQSISVKDLAELLIGLSGKKKDIIATGSTRGNEVMDVVANADKFKMRFNWSPKINMTEGLKRILDYEIKKHAVA